MANINAVTDYIISRLTTDETSLTQLKLQKLLYYAQAWHLAIFKKPLFAGKFQAWIHGPVSRVVFDRFKSDKMLYSTIDERDINGGFNSEADLTPEERAHIDNVLDEYGGLTGWQLEQLTHQEDPWILARDKRAPDERCEAEISEMKMGEYYRKRLD